jgi:glutathione S-transferase
MTGVARWRLHWAPTSPYVRKVMIVAHELGLADRLALLKTTPQTVTADVAPANPLGRIPALILADGRTLYDSLTICEYLNAEAGGDLFPAGAERWDALTRHALGNGILDDAVSRNAERRRPPAERSAAADAKRCEAVARAVDRLEADAAALAERPRIGEIAVMAALGYLDFRYPDEPWRPGRPSLARWFEAMSRRPAMTATAPYPD